MRHFRSSKDIEDFMVEEYRKQGFSVVTDHSGTKVPVAREQANDVMYYTSFDVSLAARTLWEHLS